LSAEASSSPSPPPIVPSGPSPPSMETAPGVIVEDPSSVAVLAAMAGAEGTREEEKEPASIGE